VEKFFVARDSSWREILRGESLRGDRGFVEIEASWRESLRGETSPWGKALHGERLQGERGFVERLSPRRKVAVAFPLIRIEQTNFVVKLGSLWPLLLLLGGSG